MQQKYEISFHYGQSLATTSLNIFILDVNFDKSTIRLLFLLISSIFTKFSENQKSKFCHQSINCLNFKFLYVWLRESYNVQQ